MGRPRITDKRICYACRTEDSRTNLGWACWFTNLPTDLFLCKRCYAKYIYYPNLDHSNDPIRNRKRIRVLNSRVHLRDNPRKGTCKYCNKTKGDPYIDYLGKPKIIKRTIIHHSEYDIKNPLNHTIELCDQCHRNEHIRLSSF